MLLLLAFDWLVDGAAREKEVSAHVAFAIVNNVAVHAQRVRLVVVERAEGLDVVVRAKTKPAGEGGHK